MDTNKNGKNTIIIEDIERKPLSYKNILQASLVLGRKLNLQTSFKENVGILLPTSNAATLSFMALQMYGRIPTMLNFSLGAAAISSASHTACVKNIITSKRFVMMMKLDSLISELATQANIIYLEEIRSANRLER